MRLLPVILFILLFGCERQQREEKSYFSEELSAVYSIRELNDRFVNVQSIEAAPGSWHAAMRLSAHANGFKRVDYCLLVKTPYQLEPGQIKFVQMDDLAKNCSDHLFSKESSIPLEYYNLLVEYEKGRLVLKVDQDQYSYNFFNLRDRPVVVSLDRGEANAFEEALLADGVVCKQVADDCSESRDRCDLCENGSYYIKNSKCLNSYSKICGVDHCGKKGEPACIRGHVSSGVKDYCIQDSPVGFCSGDRRVACVDGFLICE